MTRVYVMIAMAIFLCVLVGTLLVTFVSPPADMILSFAFGGVIGITLSYLVIKDQNL